MIHQYEAAFVVAEENGWDIDSSATTMRRNGPAFIRGSTHLWKIRDGWQCSNLINNMFCNHRQYANLLEALLQKN